MLPSSVAIVETQKSLKNPFSLWLVPPAVGVQPIRSPLLRGLLSYRPLVRCTPLSLPLSLSLSLSLSRARSPVAAFCLLWLHGHDDSSMVYICIPRQSCAVRVSALNLPFRFSPSLRPQSSLSLYIFTFSFTQLSRLTLYIRSSVRLHWSPPPFYTHISYLTII